MRYQKKKKFTLLPQKQESLKGNMTTTTAFYFYKNIFNQKIFYFP